MIENLEIRIERWFHPDEKGKSAVQLRATVLVSGRKYFFQQILPETELQSRFEQIWERGGIEVLELIKKEQSE